MAFLADVLLTRPFVDVCHSPHEPMKPASSDEARPRWPRRLAPAVRCAAQSATAVRRAIHAEVVGETRDHLEPGLTGLAELVAHQGQERRRQRDVAVGVHHEVLARQRDTLRADPVVVGVRIRPHVEAAIGVVELGRDRLEGHLLRLRRGAAVDGNGRFETSNFEVSRSQVTRTRALVLAHADCTPINWLPSSGVLEARTIG